MFPLGTYHAESRKARLQTSSFQRSVKRGFDISVSAAGLLLILPIILSISLVLLIGFSWPLLCRHKRYNSANVEFNIFQFRTTITEQQEKTLNGSRDRMKRLTGLGKILRRTGIDKIPQLINVLRGEMSIVGNHLFKDAPGSVIPPLDLGDVKPGLIAWTHPDDDHDIADTDKSIYYCIKCDRFYIENFSLLFDIKIIFHTIFSKLTY